MRKRKKMKWNKLRTWCKERLLRLKKPFIIVGCMWFVACIAGFFLNCLFTYHFKFRLDINLLVDGKTYLYALLLSAIALTVALAYHKPRFSCSYGKLRAGAETRFEQHIRNVVFDDARRNAEFFGNFSIAVSARHKAQDFKFLFGKFRTECKSHSDGLRTVGIDDFAAYYSFHQRQNRLFVDFLVPKAFNADLFCTLYMTTKRCGGESIKYSYISKNNDFSTHYLQRLIKCERCKIRERKQSGDIGVINI